MQTPGDPAYTAFFRLEGGLVHTSPAAAAAWLAARRQRMSERAGAVVASLLAGVSSAVPWFDARDGHALLWLPLRDTAEDRLVLLGEDLAADLAARVRPAARRLLDATQDRGGAPVILSALPDVVVAPLAEALGVSHRWCNRLEVVEGRATGRLMEPVLTVVDGASAVRFASAHGLPDTLVHAYAGRAADAPLLAGVPRPCAIAPEPSLRRIARATGWPTVEA
jgi:phosphoserine phosphatase